MPDPAHMRHSTGGSTTSKGETKIINSELWHACAGPLVSIPDIGSYCVYLPQGHSEQVAASTQQDVAAQIPNYHPNLPSQLVCHLHDVILHADMETDEVYCQMTLQPVNVQERESCLVPDNSSPSKQPSIFFCKMLTASDTSTHGGFSIPRRAAERVFPALDFSLQPPVQEIIARDLHDTEWRFRHIFRGQPKRHLLTTGWSVFVSAKRLMAGDSILFIRNDKNSLFLGIRRANRPQTFIPSSFLSSDSMHIGVLAAAAHAASTNSRFTVFYKPRANPSEFVVPLSKFKKAVYHTSVSVGMRFRMLFETEESSVRRYMGTVTHIGDLDPARWPNSPWRSIKVGWDESNAGDRPRRVSLWEIEPLTSFLVYPPPSSWRLRPSWPLPNGLEGFRSPAIWAQYQHTSGLPHPPSAMNPLLGSMQHLHNPTAGMYDASKGAASQESFTLNQLQLQQQHMQLDEVQLRAQAQPQQPTFYSSCVQSQEQTLPFSRPSFAQTLHSLADYQKSNDYYMRQSGPVPQADGQPGYPPLQQALHSFEQLHQGPYQATSESSGSQVVSTSILSMPHLSPTNSGTNGGLVTALSGPLQSSTAPPSNLCPGMEPTNHNSLTPCFSPHFQRAFEGNSTDASFQVDVVMQPHDSAPMLPLASDTTHKPMLYSESDNHLSSHAITTAPESFKPGNENEDFYGQCSHQGDSMELLSNAPIPNEQFCSNGYLEAAQAWGYAASRPTRTYTKVYKSGSVGRSLDLTRFSDYNELRCELEKFFGLEGQLEDPGSGWKLVFLDKEDDWLLLGDDPWEVFINNVRSLKILSPFEFVGFRSEVSMQQQQQRSYKSEDARGQQEPHYPNSVITSTAYMDF